MIKFERLSEKLYGTLSGYHYEIKMYTDGGSATIDPTEACKFFVVDPRMLISVDKDEGRITLNISSDEEFKTTKKLQKRLKALANEFIVNYTIRNYGKRIVPRDFAMDAKIKQSKDYEKEDDGITFQEKSESLQESFSRMFGHKKTSYQQVHEVKIKVKHTRSVNEEKRGARSRNIKSITLEWEGEKYVMPTNNLNSARAMANHVSRGGQVDDKVGKYISESATKLKEMVDFLKYASKNKLINEGTKDIVSLLKEKISSIRGDFSSLKGAQTYASTKDKIETYSDDLNEEHDGHLQVDDIRDKFTVKYFDDAFENLLPNINKMISERDQRNNIIEEQSKSIGGVDITPISGLQFQSVRHKVSYVLLMVASNSPHELKCFLGDLCDKIGREEELGDFEQRIASNVIESLSEH